MSYPSTTLDKLSVELNDLAVAYADKAAALASDPYFRDAVMKVSVSNFVWALYHAFDDRGRLTLNDELKEQSAAVDRAVSATGSTER